MSAAAAVFCIFLLPLLPSFSSASPSPYLSSATLLRNYQNMLTTFKIFIYTPSKPYNFPHTPSSIFHSTLLRSPFITQNPAEAHLFFVPFSPDTSTRSLARVIRELRWNHPYWNRTLGADHFFISSDGIDYSSDRNVLELKKNSIQVSIFPVVSGYHVPHKDITLPPVGASIPRAASNVPGEISSRTLFLGHLKWDGITDPDFVGELRGDPLFFVEEKSEPLNVYLRNVRESKFCLFLYRGNLSGLVDAMDLGCVPVVIVDRAIQDLPLMDVLRWSDLALLVARRSNSGGGERLKRLLQGVSEEKYMEMSASCVSASQHLLWNDEAQPLDAFHMVMYQLWLRRHAIRYSRRDFVDVDEKQGGAGDGGR